ncbi:hypothetical protein [Pseudoalteromonas umbrosa]|uniref:hypothetical protein n=1 Tax=Pseudoalteromonas umbrosa TaxID=3048489 RepID=UPI0024C2FFC0|nr:hypothetical protein [Pseudoalteromonas sp. B95]MDK1290152.1 hypothetical protein [Pseudoalteromonas sp. B95]
MSELYNSKNVPTFDSLNEDNVFRTTNDHAGELVNQHLNRFRDAVKDQMVDREMSRSELTGSAAMAMVSAFTKASDTKRAYSQSLKHVQKYYLVDALLNLVADETLVADIMTGEIVHLQSPRKEVDDELKLLQRRLNLDQIFEDITLDLLSYGDYTLSMDLDPEEGVVAISDDVQQENIVALYRHGLPEKYLVRETNRILIKPASTHLHFALGRSKLRIDLGEEFGVKDKDLEALKKKLPSYIRVGRPLLHGVQSKLKELQLLESLVPASKLHQLSTGSIVGVSVPPQTEPKEAFAISRRYEQLLNNKTSLDKRSGDLSDVGSILSTAGRTKCVPVLGDKGNLQTVDVKENRTADDMLSNIRDNRATICATIGVPPELLFGSESSESKGEFLKRHARYLRKIKSIQAALANGAKQLAMAHLLTKGIQVLPQDIHVVFRNEVVNIDELDKLEFADQVNSMVSDLWMFMTELNDSEQFNGRIDFEALSDWMRRQMALFGSNRSFILPLQESLNEQTQDKAQTQNAKQTSSASDATESDIPKDAILDEAIKLLASKLQEVAADVGDEINYEEVKVNKEHSEAAKTNNNSTQSEHATVVDETGTLNEVAQTPASAQAQAQAQAQQDNQDEEIQP